MGVQRAGAAGARFASHLGTPRYADGNKLNIMHKNKLRDISKSSNPILVLAAALVAGLGLLALIFLKSLS